MLRTAVVLPMCKKKTISSTNLLPVFDKVILVNPYW